MRRIFVILILIPLLCIPAAAFGWTRSDLFGYHAQITSFDWIDARRGSRLTLSGDDNITVYGFLPFSIKFYGLKYFYIIISTNGLISFDIVSASSRNNSPLPYPGLPNNIICPFWDDLVIESGAVYVYFDSIRNIFVVQWDDLTDATYHTDNLTFQVQFIKSTGEIRFMYASMVGTIAAGTSASVGIENGDGSTGIRYVDEFSPGLIGDGLGLSFSPPYNLPVMSIKGCFILVFLFLLVIFNFLRNNGFHMTFNYYE
ncbi:MAG: hypothetical protein A2161_18195 [Candidatus Schekmanbacteria bacterium RBG_13_48_7]|uniref:Uncharacterized protein n=1 Tax=Candidatus Schekmanbacteria bacterium RBG_13_48_7 TaxID=1817878 RepID=A0A1F7RQS9_9BACT|nr:MAG: hypothetical protein A2161_18195 [Candidatus Schekmanbacteria bacterium RBG_13_48_7]